MQKIAEMKNEKWKVKVKSESEKWNEKKNEKWSYR